MITGDVENVSSECVFACSTNDIAKVATLELVGD